MWGELYWQNVPLSATISKMSLLLDFVSERIILRLKPNIMAVKGKVTNNSASHMPFGYSYTFVSSV